MRFFQKFEYKYLEYLIFMVVLFMEHTPFDREFS